MTDTLEQETTTSIPNHERSGTRRKVRKGTRSCWECKRRKIKCTFASTEHVTCIGCERQRAPCVSQDLPEYLSPARKGNRNLVERIARVEKLMHDFIASNGAGATGQVEKEARKDRRSISTAINPRSSDSVPSPIRPALSSAEVCEILTHNNVEYIYIYIDYCLVSSRIRSKLITAHTGRAMCIRPNLY